MHYIHHLGDMKSNLGMLNLGIDGLFGSLALEDPVRMKKRQESSVLRSGAEGSNSNSKMIHLYGAGALDEDKLPTGITLKLLQKSSKAAGIVAAALGFDVPLEVLHGSPDDTAIQRGLATLVLRVFYVCVCVYFWSFAEHSLRAGEVHFLSLQDTQAHADKGHAAFSGLLAWLQRRESTHVLNLATACRFSELISECSVLCWIVLGIFGKTVRPILSVGSLVVARYVVRMGGYVPVVASQLVLWHVPDAPQTSALTNFHLFVHPDTAHVFFNGRVALSVVTAFEIIRRQHVSGRSRLLTMRVLMPFLGLAAVAYQICITLTTRSAYTFDVLVAVMAAKYCSVFAEKFSVFVDKVAP